MDEVEDFINQLQAENTELKNKNSQLALAQSAYNGKEDNLIAYQLDPGELLARLEHFLRGDYVGIDEHGNENWIKQTDEELILFNEYGINSIMSIIGQYVDKNTMLSFYQEERINEILADLGDELANFIFCNYDQMGMNTAFKKTRYQLTVVTILNTVESAYRRSLKGKTMEDLNTSRIFTQQDYAPRREPTNVQPKRSLFKPSTW